MKSLSPVYATLLLIGFCFASTRSVAQKKESTKSTKNYHLHKINYLSSNIRFGYGLESSKLAISNDWKYKGGRAIFMGAGFNYVIKNNFGFDLQFNHTRSKFNYENIGPYFKTGYSATGVEMGIRKLFLKKRDDTFYLRAAFGVNFIIKANETYANKYYNFSSNPGATPNLYALPEIGYQIRLNNPLHIVTLSAMYKYSLSDVATTNMTFTDDGNANEVNSAGMSGTYFAFALKYTYLIKAYKEKSDARYIDKKF